MQNRGRWHQSHGRGRWRNTWSGWHGRWHLDARGRQGVLKFWVNFRGRESQVRFHRIPVELPLVNMGGFSILPCQEQGCDCSRASVQAYEVGEVRGSQAPDLGSRSDQDLEYP